MDKPLQKDDTNLVDYKVNIQMVTFIVVIVVVVLTLIYFIRIYSSQKEIVLKDMSIEANLLETIITNHLNYSKYFVSIIRKNIKMDPNNLDYIKEILQEHLQPQDFSTPFGWKKYSWINKDFRAVVTSNSGIKINPKYIPYIKGIINDIEFNNSNRGNNFVFYIKQTAQKTYLLKLIDNIFDTDTGKYIGSIIVSYDIAAMMRNLNSRKKNASTNFVIINSQYKVIAQSKPIIDNIINDKGLLTSQLQTVLKNLDFKQGTYDYYSYLDMLNGINYFIKPLKNLPFILIVNIDDNIIKHNILDSITKKFIEVSIFAFICLFMIISIYKRETMLRAKAEKATRMANVATKAKTDFLAFTAHEIRSPLGFILTGAEIMTKELLGELPKPYMKYAEGIHQNSKIIIDFITDILDENQIIEGKFKIVNSLSNIQGIINEAFEVNLARYNKRNVKLVPDFKENLPLLICDRRRILQVISNLVSNSIKYSKDNTTIMVSVRMLENNDMEIQVSDQGIGMSVEEIPIALSPYGTIKKNDYYSIGSYGLGLPIVKMLLDAHDASLVIKSKEGTGTTVKIVFPKYKLVYNNKKNKE